MQTRLSIAVRRGALAVAIAAGAAAPAAGETPARMSAVPAAVTPYIPGMTVRSLAGRADNDLVELAPGRRMRVGDLRRLDAAAQRLRRSQTQPLTGLRAAPSRTGATPLRNADDIAAALRRPGSEVLQLPSGRTLTAEQLRFVMPRAERQLGRPLASAAGGHPAPGRAIRVDAQTDWGAVLARPDDTPLASPSGRRITVGALKRELAAQTGQRAPSPATGSRP